MIPNLLQRHAMYQSTKLFHCQQIWLKCFNLHPFSCLFMWILPRTNSLGPRAIMLKTIATANRTNSVPENAKARIRGTSSVKVSLSFRRLKTVTLRIVIAAATDSVEKTMKIPMAILQNSWLANGVVGWLEAHDRAIWIAAGTKNPILNNGNVKATRPMSPRTALNIVAYTMAAPTSDNVIRLFVRLSRYSTFSVYHGYGEKRCLTFYCVFKGFNILFNFFNMSSEEAAVLNTVTYVFQHLLCLNRWRCCCWLNLQIALLNRTEMLIVWVHTVG